MKIFKGVLNKVRKFLIQLSFILTRSVWHKNALSIYIHHLDLSNFVWTRWNRTIRSVSLSIFLPYLWHLHKLVNPAVVFRLFQCSFWFFEFSSYWDIHRQSFGIFPIHSNFGRICYLCSFFLFNSQTQSTGSRKNRKIM